MLKTKLGIQDSHWEKVTLSLYFLYVISFDFYIDLHVNNRLIMCSILNVLVNTIHNIRRV
ncbi:hypothetical protein J1TS3_13360 [Siminovitchia fordii]|uniref:Uncharacterized protein n=1 Tax=Siminovitchia fordii TaxID=254759 RepID=A0ABQ4K376_9BACI|nr:hypothetical protein J1TS3_13360 [Siminovitchia fordii]